MGSNWTRATWFLRHCEIYSPARTKVVNESDTRTSTTTDTSTNASLQRVESIELQHSDLRFIKPLMYAKGDEMVIAALVVALTGATLGTLSLFVNLAMFVHLRADPRLAATTPSGSESRPGAPTGGSVPHK